MRFDIVFSSPLEQGDALARAGAYMERAGYKREAVSAKFSRGSKMGSIFAWSPNALPAAASFAVNPQIEGGSLVRLWLEVNLQGQWVTARDKRFWEKEFNGLASVLDATQQTYPSGAPEWPITVYFGWGSAGLLFLGVFLGAFAGSTLLQSAAGAAAGALLGGFALMGTGLRYDMKKAQAQKTRPVSAVAQETVPVGAVPGTSYAERQVVAGEVVEPAEAAVADPHALPADVRALETRMYAEARSWAVWGAMLGLISVTLSGLSSSWGVTLLLVSAGSFLFPAPPIFVVYAVTLVWVAVSNAFSGSTSWLIFAALQAVLGYSTFRTYLRYRPVDAAYVEAAADPLGARPRPAMARATRWFPWLSMGLGGVGFVGFAVFVGLSFLGGLTRTAGLIDQTGYFLAEICVDLAVLGLGMGIGALLSKYKPTLPAILGTVLSAMTVLGMLGLLLLAVLA